MWWLKLKRYIPRGLGNEAEQSPTTRSRATMVSISQRSDYTIPATYPYIGSARPSKTSCRIDCTGDTPCRRADFNQKAVSTSGEEAWSQVLRKADTSCNPKSSPGTTPMRFVSHTAATARLSPLPPVLRVSRSGECLQTRPPCMRAVGATLGAGAVTALGPPRCQGPPQSRSPRVN